MDDTALEFEPRLKGLTLRDWSNRLHELAGKFGTIEQLDVDHTAFFLKAGPKLIVTFENAASVRDNKLGAEPRGFLYAREEGWSSLSIISNGESWFRDIAIYEYFDDLIDDGFFDNFSDVLFYGAGSGGYAAAAYSVAAPGARVLALQPQATLNPRIASFDTRYKKNRKFDFTSRYGFAPDMIDAADAGYVVYDPTHQIDAAHGALFSRANVALLHATRMGMDLEATFDSLGIHDDMLLAAMDGTLTRKFFARLTRARRAYEPYLKRLLADALNAGHTQLAANMCYFVLRGSSDTYFAKQLKRLAGQGVYPVQAGKKPAMAQ